jgi:DNA repair photolyase
MTVVTHVEARQALTKTGGFLQGFTHTFNPAVGCLFGRGLCGQFCYAREAMAHRFAGRGAWGEYLQIKHNAPRLLRRELARAAARGTELRVFSASTTDPCLGPLLGIYGECLAAVAEHPPAAWVLQTRSPLVLRLRERIEALASCIVVSFTLETDDEDLGWAWTGSPSLAARKRTLRELASWQVPLHVAVSPCLPLRDVNGFAAWLAELGAWVTVDTFEDGDGSCGARTARSPFAAMADTTGFDWRRGEHAQELHGRLRELIGARAGWSASGFRRLAFLPEHRRDA